MAKAKQPLSQPRRSKKVIMKQLTAKRLKLQLERKIVTNSSVGDEENMSRNTHPNPESVMSCSNELNDSLREDMYIDAQESNFDFGEHVSDEDFQLSDYEEYCAIDADESFDNSSRDEVDMVEKSIQSSSDSELDDLYCENEAPHEKSFEITGRRMINVSYFFKRLKGLKHEGFDCSFFDFELISEKIEGFQSLFSFKCSVCNIIEIVKSEDPTATVNSNVSAVLGAVSTGIGYTQLSELFAAMDVPIMSSKTYSNYHNKLFPIIEQENDGLMRGAGKEEAALAIQSGDVDQDGVPIISVIVDGAWSKRSYRTNYNALSGVACIIGAKTKKILYVGVRNKFCYSCTKFGGEHTQKCYKNCNTSSTAMEAAIIAEGFAKSIEMHNLIYGRVIGDGDSSVYRKLTELAPYGPTFVVEKIECRNHLLRNYVNKLSDIAKDTRFPIGLRKNVTNSDTLGRLRNAVLKAIKYRKAETDTFANKTKSLKQDILNGPHHIFGNHSNCQKYFCNKTTNSEENVIPDLQVCGLYEVLMSFNKRLAQNSASLLHDVDTNAAENYNSIVAKYVGGKRINFSLKGSYEMRCKAAAISYNAGDCISIILKAMHKSSENQGLRFYLEKFQERRIKARALRRNGNSRKKTALATVDENYGPEASQEIPDMDEDEYKNKSEKFLGRLQEADKNKIFVESVLQSSSEVWKNERRKRITASTYGKICKLRKTTSTAKTVNSLLYSTFSGTSSTRFGLDNEDTAISLFEEKYTLSVEKCGLIIDKKYPYMACSPDGLIADNALVEIKSSAKSGHLTPLEAVVQKKIDFCIIQNGELRLKRQHNYYYQVQGLLHISERAICYFLVYTQGGLHVEVIQRDDRFWKQNMEKRLCEFYMTSLLPEIIDSRRCRQREIRAVYLN